MHLVQELYDCRIKPLPAVERLRLATLILNDLPLESMVDYREGWSDEDLRDFSQSTWQHMQATLGKVDDA